MTTHDITITQGSVSYINQAVDKDFVIKLFGKFSSKYGKLWTERLGANADWDSCFEDWHDEIGRFSLREATIAREECLAIFTKFPPTQGEFIELCLKASGVPSVTDILHMAINKKFDHPIAKIVYDKIGHWKLANGTEKELQSLAAVAYQQATADFQRDPKAHWDKLEAWILEQPMALSAPEKIPSASESQAFKDCMTRCKEILQGAPPSEKPKREFDEEKISPTNRNFDQAYYDEFCKYLLETPETRTMDLLSKYAYRRMRLLAAKEQPLFLRDKVCNPNPQGRTREPFRHTGGPHRAFTD